MQFYVLDRLPEAKSNYKNSVILIGENWDDWFRYQTMYSLYYLDSNATVTWLDCVKIGQHSMKDEQRSAVFPNAFSELPADCFSLGQSDIYYERIKDLGDYLRQEILIGLHDIAYNLNLYKSVKSLDVTYVSLMREVSDFMIQHQFSRIANGKPRLTEYDIEYTFPSVDENSGKQLTFHVTPASNPPTNIQVVIGRNNVGKTYFIKNLIKSIYSSKDEYGILRSSSSKTGRLVHSRTQAFANVLCVSFSPFDDFSDVTEITSKRATMPFSYIGLTEVDTKDMLKSYFKESFMKCLKSDFKLNLLRNAVSILESDPIFAESNIKLLLVKKNDLPETESHVNEALSLFQRLSSGHQVILLTLTQLIDCITEKSLVILDEPENHLHPPLLSAFIRALSELLIDRNGVAIITTHSPVVLQEVPRSCVWKLNRSGNELAIDRLDIESFGATIGALTREVFGLEVRMSGFHKLLKDEVDSGHDFNTIIIKFNNQLGDEALALIQTLIALRDTDETLK